MRGSRKVQVGGKNQMKGLGGGGTAARLEGGSRIIYHQRGLTDLMLWVIPETLPLEY